MRLRNINASKFEYNAEEMINEFLLLQKQKGVVKNTLRTHQSALRALHKGCTGIPATEQIRACLTPNMGNAYYNKRLSTYKRFYDMLISFGHILYNPLDTWHYRKVGFNIKNYDECTIKKFLDGIDKSTFAGFRDYVMCLFIIDTGIRPSEVVQLKKEDINYVVGQVYLRREITKTRVARVVPVSDYTIKKIRQLHSYEITEWKNEFLFCSSEGKRLNTTSLRHNIHKVALKTGINLTPYDFRHIFATTYIRNGGDAFTLQRIMGHSKPNMTMVYVNLNGTDLSVAHQRTNVLGNFVSNRVRKIK